MTTKYLLGIDIGGTYTKIGIVDTKGYMQEKWQIKTNLESPSVSYIEELWAAIQHRVGEPFLEKQMSSIGIGVPGYIDAENGMVRNAVNLHWKNVYLKDELARFTSLPIIVENDANAAVYGEYYRDISKVKNVVMVTLGTGVGSGIIIQDELLRGEHNYAAELGHFTVDRDGVRCNCGRRGCLDALVSATGILRESMAQLEASPSLKKIYDEKGFITAKDTFDLAKLGDPTCLMIVKRVADHLGYGLANFVALLNPGKILIGGGLSYAGAFFLHLIQDRFNHYALPLVAEKTKVELAKLGNDAGIIGAALLSKKTYT